ncbi:phosphoadenosine phosphosulfate reductase family protein [Desulfosporosinus youngiae]|nr:phosphoadenosine phosphosulfate reductase family protein [Desulfosporosinus youngiae]
MPETRPHVTLNEEGVCNICLDHERARAAKLDFSSIEQPERLQMLLKKVGRLKGSGQYDCAVAVSGGKDSIMTLDIARKVLKLNPLAVFIDNGFALPEMYENIGKAVDILEIDLIQHKCQAAKHIFRLFFASGKPVYYCRVCHALIDLLVYEICSRFDIPLILGGYTKGQNYIAQSELFWIYKITDENAASLLADSPYALYAEVIRDSRMYFARHYPGIARLSPFKYLDYNEDKIIEHIAREYGFVLPEHSWPKKSANCSFNFVSQYLARRQFGYTQHETELSQMVREGETSREEALEACNTPITASDLEDPLAILGLHFSDLYKLSLEKEEAAP